jgi:hypothetical protein
MWKNGLNLAWCRNTIALIIIQPSARINRSSVLGQNLVIVLFPGIVVCLNLNRVKQGNVAYKCIRELLKMQGITLSILLEKF